MFSNKRKSKVIYFTESVVSVMPFNMGRMISLNALTQRSYEPDLI